MIQTTGALHKFIFIGAVYAIKPSPYPHPPKNNNNQPTNEKTKKNPFQLTTNETSQNDQMRKVAA